MHGDQPPIATLGSGEPPLAAQVIGALAAAAVGLTVWWAMPPSTEWLVDRLDQYVSHGVLVAWLGLAPFFLLLHIPLLGMMLICQDNRVIAAGAGRRRVIPSAAAHLFACVLCIDPFAGYVVGLLLASGLYAAAGVMRRGQPGAAAVVVLCSAGSAGLLFNMALIVEAAKGC